MILRKWEDLPEFMCVKEVLPYWEGLNKKRKQLLVKRVCDFILAIILLFIFAIPMGVIAIIIKLDSSGSVFYRQERVTTYGRRFLIYKFRTMITNADKMGDGVTIADDSRITKVGTILRKFRLDEVPQLINVIKGDMSFVGTRPESVQYVKKYRPEYYATLLMPAGITSEASIRYKDEDKLLVNKGNVDEIYINNILPAKMKWNLKSLKHFCFIRDIITMFRTLAAVLEK